MFKALVKRKGRLRFEVGEIRQMKGIATLRAHRFVPSCVVAFCFIASQAFALAEPGPLNPSEASGPATIASVDSLTWKRSLTFDGRTAAAAVAVATDVHRGWVAIGGEQGLLIARPKSASAPLRHSIEGIQDLCFGPSGELYIATIRGFWVLPSTPDGFAMEPVEVTPANGELARRVRRVVVGPSFVSVATDAGAYVAQIRNQERGRRAELVWRQLNADFPAGAVTSIAIQQEADQYEVWVVVGSAVWRAVLSSAGRIVRVREEVLPDRSHGDPPVDLVAGLPAGSVALVYSQVIHLRVRDTATRVPRWKTIRPVLPPGASIERIGFGADVYWLATDRGLLVSQSAAGPWRRAGPPAGRAAAHAAAALGARLYVASAGGLLVADRARGVSPHDGRRQLPGTPPVLQVHRAALREQGLEASVIHEAWRGVKRRAWLPVLGLRFDADRDRGRGRDRDEVFVSGEYHELRDSDRNRSLDLGASMTMTWDFRDLSYEPEQIDLSREARLVIGLRDDVLDEVNQVYFERLAVQAELAAPGPQPADADPGELLTRHYNLELRLAHLDAALDAWTGGWWSEQFERVARDPD